MAGLSCRKRAIYAGVSWIATMDPCLCNYNLPCVVILYEFQVITSSVALILKSTQLIYTMPKSNMHGMLETSLSNDHFEL